MYRATTGGIEVSVSPRFLEDQSDPGSSRFVWAYHVTIVNNSDRTLKLLERHWRIFDATGHMETVDGEGVVGEQPLLAPGDSFQYTSGCPLTTSSGIMEGHYTMVDAYDERMDVEIPAFSLDLPHTRRTLN